MKAVRFPSASAAHESSGLLAKGSVKVIFAEVHGAHDCRREEKQKVKE